MKNLSSIQQVADSIKRLRETHGYEIVKIAALLNLNIKEYSKLERGSRPLNLEHLCILADFYKVRRSVVLDYGNPNNQDTNEAIQRTLAELEVATKWLKEIHEKIEVLQMKLNKRKSA